MNFQSNKNQPKGFTLVGALAAATVFAILVTLVGKNLYSLIKERQRSESKVAVIDNEDTLANLVTRRVLSLINMTPALPALPGERCKFDARNPSPSFRDLFNQEKPKLAGGNVTLEISNPTQADFSLVNTPETFQADLKAAITSCATKPVIPVSSNNFIGTFLFCVKVVNTNTGGPTAGTASFVGSQAAFAEIRIDLTSFNVPQEVKLLGDASLCADWGPVVTGAEDLRQMKVTYRIFWKNKVGNTEKDYFSKTGSQIINVSELLGNS